MTSREAFEAWAIDNFGGRVVWSHDGHPSIHYQRADLTWFLSTSIDTEFSAWLAATERAAKAAECTDGIAPDVPTYERSLATLVALKIAADIRGTS